jgi:hypothetical protein
MKIKVMPLFGAVMALAAVAAPLTAKAQTMPSRYTLLAQAQPQPNQWVQLNPSDAQKRQLYPARWKTRKPIQAIYAAQQREKLKILKAKTSNCLLSQTIASNRSANTSL